jgi:site-specific DNA-methyltransferase (adenine-specific)
MNGDCLELMKEIPSGSVDLVLCDLPYGTTACKWDAVVPFEPLWKEYRRVITGCGSIVLTASQPFTTTLAASNIEMLKYSLVWEKQRVGGFFDVKFRPLKSHEDVLIFSKGGCANGSLIPMTYNPQGIVKVEKKWGKKPLSGNTRSAATKEGVSTEGNYPRSVLKIDSEFKTVHPTQKPVALMEYLIRTYTNEGMTVLDNCMGSGTTGVACVNTGRKFIGIEKDEAYFEIAKNRISDAESALLAREAS